MCVLAVTNSVRTCMACPCARPGLETHSISSGLVSCQSCHMPLVNGVASHEMAGGTDPSMVGHAVIMTMEVSRSGADVAVKVTLKNTLTHNFPTGAPFRFAYIALTAHDTSGRAVWKNDRQGVDDPQSVLTLKLVDEDGKLAAPPAARLKPGKSRIFTFKVPPATMWHRCKLGCIIVCFCRFLLRNSATSCLQQPGLRLWWRGPKCPCDRGVFSCSSHADSPSIQGRYEGPRDPSRASRTTWTFVKIWPTHPRRSVVQLRRKRIGGIRFLPGHCQPSPLDRGRWSTLQREGGPSRESARA